MCAPNKRNDFDEVCEGDRSLPLNDSASDGLRLSSLPPGGADDVRADPKADFGSPSILSEVGLDLFCDEARDRVCSSGGNVQGRTLR